ncbi:MAG: Short-chain dehydrogenase [Gemmatimonadetes bacterium]|nr:Short-chain dehydrogenase [Gemmatimonadota bacterium]
MTKPFAGKVVLITGPARGIGEECARQLAAAGARLSLVGLEPARLASLAAELGAGHLWSECDVTDQSQLERAVSATLEVAGRIDVVIANAGVASNGTVAVADVEALVRTIQVNLIGVVRTVKATLPAVVASEGYFLLISSAAAISALPAMSTYAAAKSGVEVFGNALRIELAHKGVDVGVAHPCWIDTDLVRDTQQDLESFRKMLKGLPGPFGSITTVQACVAALLGAIEHRKRKVFIPASLAPYAAFRQFFSSPIMEWATKRKAKYVIPRLEREVLALGRPFGEHSAGMGEAPKSS